MGLLRQFQEVRFSRNVFVFKGKERAEVHEQLSVINEKIERFSINGFSKNESEYKNSIPQSDSTT